MYDFPVKGPWALTDPSYAAFEKALQRLLEMSDADWKTACGDKPGYVMARDDKNPADAYLRELVTAALA
jgi:hypothetical protein